MEVVFRLDLDGAIVPVLISGCAQFAGTTPDVIGEVFPLRKIYFVVVDSLWRPELGFAYC
jgi:hypothetical protein